MSAAGADRVGLGERVAVDRQGGRIEPYLHQELPRRRTDIPADHAGLGPVPGPRGTQPQHDCPVTVDNDVNIMAIGERPRGVTRAIDNFLFVKIGIGIYVSSAIYRDVDGGVGDIGHIQIDAHGPSSPAATPAARKRCSAARPSPATPRRRSEVHGLDGFPRFIQCPAVLHGVAMSMHPVMLAYLRGEVSEPISPASPEVTRLTRGLVSMLQELVNGSRKQVRNAGKGVGVGAAAFVAAIAAAAAAFMRPMPRLPATIRKIANSA